MLVALLHELDELARVDVRVPAALDVLDDLGRDRGRLMRRRPREIDEVRRQRFSVWEGQCNVTVSTCRLKGII